MAITISKRILSGSSNGYPINVSSTTTSGTLIHTGPTSTNTIDELWVYAQNSSTNNVDAFIEIGDASASQLIRFQIQAQGGPEVIIPGFLVQGTTATGISITIGASTSNVISVYGYVNRITQ